MTRGLAHQQGQRTGGEELHYKYLCTQIEIRCQRKSNSLGSPVTSDMRCPNVVGKVVAESLTGPSDYSNGLDDISCRNISIFVDLLS